SDGNHAHDDPHQQANILAGDRIIDRAAHEEWLRKAHKRGDENEHAHDRNPPLMRAEQRNDPACGHGMFAKLLDIGGAGFPGPASMDSHTLPPSDIAEATSLCGSRSMRYVGVRG